MEHRKELHIPYSVFDTWSDLPESVASLLHQAKQASQDAYSPYSKFKVGSAVLLSNGEVVLGHNQENAAYPSGLCAERVALFASHVQYPNESVRTIAVYAQGIKEPVAPCGSCRQVMSEFEHLGDEAIDLYLAAENKVIYMRGIASLLPLPFSFEK